MSGFWSRVHAYRRGEVSGLDILSDVFKYRTDKSGGILARLPDSTFFLHTSVWGTTGAGKSNIYEQLIKRWAGRAVNGDMSLVLVDGSVFPSRVVRYVDRELKKLDSKNIILIDVQPDSAGKINHLIETNIFDVPSAFKGRVTSEYLVGTYLEICRSLLNQPLSQLMETLFRNAVQLMMAAGTPSMRLLRDVIDEPGNFLDDHDVEIDREVRLFFERRVMVKSSKYARTRDDVVSRLDSLLSSPIIRHLFCSDNPKVNLFDAVNKGCLLIVATRSADVSDDAASTIGRLITTVAQQIAQTRANASAVDCMLLIDELPDYLVDKDLPALRIMQKKNRKLRVGCATALQQPDDMSSDLFKTVTGCSAIKLVGKMENDGDASKLAKIMRVPAEDIMALKTGEFFCKVRDLHETAIKITIAPGALGRWRNDRERKLMENQARESVDRCRRIMAKRYGSCTTTKARKRPKRGTTTTPKLVKVA